MGAGRCCGSWQNAICHTTGQHVRWWCSISAVGDVVQSFFANSKTALAMRLMAEERPDREELARMKALIASYEEETK